MQFQKLEALKKKYKAYSAAIDSFEGYLTELEQERVYVIEPNILSKRLHIPYREAIHLLGLAEQIHLLKRGYQVFTNDDVFPLGNYEDPDKIPDTIYNPATGEEVEKENFFIDLVFYLPKKGTSDSF